MQPIPNRWDKRKHRVEFRMKPRHKLAREKQPNILLYLVELPKRNLGFSFSCRCKYIRHCNKVALNYPSQRNPRASYHSPETKLEPKIYFGNKSLGHSRIVDQNLATYNQNVHNVLNSFTDVGEAASVTAVTKRTLCTVGWHASDTYYVERQTEFKMKR